MEQGRSTLHGGEREADLVVARLDRLPFSRRHFGIASILGAGTFFDAYDSLAIATALTVIFTTLHIGFVNTGVLIGAAYIGQFVGSVTAGALSERLGRKNVFIIALLILGIFSIGTAFSWNFESLLAFRILQGLGLGAEIPIAGALLNEFIPGNSRGLLSVSYQNMFGWGLFFTPLVGLAIFAAVGPRTGWRIALLFGALPILLAVMAHFRLPESPRWLLDRGRIQEADSIVTSLEQQFKGRTLPEPQVRARPDTKATKLGELFSRAYLPRTALIWIMFASTYFITYGYSVWLPTLYVQLGNLTPKQALALTVIAGAVTIVDGYIFAALVDRLGRRFFFTFCFLFTALSAAAGVIAILGFGYSGWPLLFGVTLLLRISSYPVNIGLFMYTAELFPTRMRGWASGTGSGVQRLASAISPAIVGILLAGASRNGSGIASVFILFGAVALVGFITVAFLGIETRGRTLEELAR